ncbi:hypothetical protein C9374_010189 [Naegleria lovaniensis]|uniref:HORMA domain-containing protein n=1 Tax=Naegleria lovaniensis TaxID=51637 RepID=A0AA88KE10_NAELO|nr:uncharacterized protein C9374_010189 [Naegleria lovaniensis]KAG2375185.1 hypothetical protein C9374_010189 [Naegleria lovaniensis]
MSSTAQQSRTQSVTYEESLTLMRNLMRTAISSVCYLRNIFPEDCFQDKSLSGINIKSLQPANDEARTLIDWLEKGVFEALKKKYLRVIIFGVCSDPSNEMESMIESYEFKITYPDREGAQVNVSRVENNQTNKKVGIKCGQTKQEITQSMIMMLRTLITLAQTLQPIPETRYITMKLLYYEDITPADYEPAFFRALREEESKQFNKDFVKLKIGQVETQYHSLNIRVRTMSENFECDAEGKNETTSNEESHNVASFPLEKNHDSTPTASQWTVRVQEQKKADQVMSVSKSEQARDDNESDATQLSQEELASNNADEEMKKLSKEIERVGLFSFTTKDVKTMFSKISALRNEDIIAFIEKKRKDAVKEMEDQERSYVKALAFVLSEEYITVSALSSEVGISTYLATKLLTRMEKENYVKAASNKRKGKKVIPHEGKLKEVMEMLSYINNEIKDSTKEATHSNTKNKLPAQKEPNSDSEQEEEDLTAKNGKKKSITPLDRMSKKQEEVRKNSEDLPKTTGVKRKTISQFEVSYSQDGLCQHPQASFNMEEYSQRALPNHNKVSTVVEPIQQKKRKFYRDPKKLSSM